MNTKREMTLDQICDFEELSWRYFDGETLSEEEHSQFKEGILTLVDLHRDTLWTIAVLEGTTGIAHYDNLRQPRK